jgi:four helix bundle protein
MAHPIQPQEAMIILTKMYDLLSWLMPCLEKFPRTQRFLVVARLANAALDVQEMLFEANARTGKARLNHLESADAALNKVRLYLRLAHDWRWLNPGQYKHVSAMVAEVGRLLGGWIKQTKAKPKADQID